MLIAKFNDGTEIELTQRTTVYPSGSATTRSYMLIYAPDNMSVDAFAAIVGDENKTSVITLTSTDENGKVKYTNVYKNFVVLAKVGKERVTFVETETGEPTDEIDLVARLEQLTYTEQSVKDYTETTDEIGAQALYTAMMTDTLL